MPRAAVLPSCTGVDDFAAVAEAVAAGEGFRHARRSGLGINRHLARHPISNPAAAANQRPATVLGPNAFTTMSAGELKMAAAGLSRSGLWSTSDPTVLLRTNSTQRATGLIVGHNPLRHA